VYGYGQSRASLASGRASAPRLCDIAQPPCALAANIALLCDLTAAVVIPTAPLRLSKPRFPCPLTISTTNASLLCCWRLRCPDAPPYQRGARCRRVVRSLPILCCHSSLVGRSPFVVGRWSFIGRARSPASSTAWGATTPPSSPTRWTHAATTQPTEPAAAAHIGQRRIAPLSSEPH
jgi:hypothetical protein